MYSKPKNKILLKNGITIEDNILKGRKFQNTPINQRVGQIFLDVMNKNPNHVAQVIKYIINF